MQPTRPSADDHASRSLSASLARVIEVIGRGATESSPDIDGPSFVGREGIEVGLEVGITLQSSDGCDMHG
jgi:hypothetical protein